MKKETRIKIANDALKMGVMSEEEYNTFIKHCNLVDDINIMLDEKADNLYGRIVNKQATINLKDDEGI